MTRKMHPEEQRMFDELSSKGVSVRSMHPDEAGASDIEGADVAIITIDAGNVGHARDSALTCNEAVKTKPHIVFVFGINGCVDDPRECDEIPAAAVVLKTLFESLSQAAFHRFALEQQAMMLVASGYGLRIGGGKMSVPPWLKDPGVITRWRKQ